MRYNLGLAEELLPSQKVLCCMAFVYWLVRGPLGTFLNLNFFVM